MAALRTEFGFHPWTLDLQVGHLVVSPLPDLAATVAGVEADAQVERG